MDNRILYAGGALVLVIVAAILIFPVEPIQDEGPMPSGNDNALLEGKWLNEDNDGYEFSGDDVKLINDGETAAEGEFVFDDGSLSISAGGLSMTVDARVDGDSLTVTVDGEDMGYTLDNGDSDGESDSGGESGGGSGGAGGDSGDSGGDSNGDDPGDEEGITPFDEFIPDVDLYGLWSDGSGQNFAIFNISGTCTISVMAQEAECIYTISEGILLVRTVEQTASYTYDISGRTLTLTNEFAPTLILTKMEE